MPFLEGGQAMRVGLPAQKKGPHDIKAETQGEAESDEGEPWAKIGSR